jgi:hypothetical protein
MLPDFTLPLFPEGSLVSSIITTTWVGVWVVAMLNLRLGWVLSGLVVPGYLVPLLLLRPWGAAIVILESIVTYVVVWLLSEAAPRAGQWSRLFGRDRFFALVLASVVVRIAFDGWLLPIFGQALNDRFGLFIPYAGEFHSFGLIIISLTANQFWKTGLPRGLLVLATTLGLTYLIVRYGLMEFTNFRISNLNYLYEDVATSILASPKAYIILLTTAFLASRMNLKYGLDYSGILIPALVALQWYQPTKIVTTVAEALIIYAVALLLLRLPVFAQVTIEGARKLLLFFNISFAYKLALGFLLLWLAPGQKVTDYFGFGYLLATLLAMKMHEKKIVPRMTRVTLQTSLAGAAIASVLGFAIMLAAEPIQLFGSRAAANAAAAAAPDTGALADLFDHDRVELYGARLQGAPPAQPPGQVAVFVEGLQLLQRYGQEPSPALLDAARAALRSIDYNLQEIGSRYLYLRDARPGLARGAYVVDLRAPGSLSIQVPLPLEARGLAAVGFRLFRSIGARSLAVAGAEWTPTGDIGGSVLQDGSTFFQAFHRTMSQGNVLQLRAQRTASDAAAESVAAEAANALWVYDFIPPDLSLAALRDIVGPFATPFGSTRQANLQRVTAAGSFAELRMTEAAVRQVLAGAGGGAEPAGAAMPVDGTSIRRLIGAAAARIAPRGSESYLPPTLGQLIYFDAEVAAELLYAAQYEYEGGGFTAAGSTRVAAAAAAAAALGYRVRLVRDSAEGSEFLLLEEDGSSPARGSRGIYLLRLGAAEEYLIQVPRPLKEAGTADYGLTLFTKLRARALSIAGAHPETNADGTADVSAPRNGRNLFNLMQQVLLRDLAVPAMAIVQCRAMRRPAADSGDFDVVLSLADGTTAPDGLSPLQRRLHDRLRADGLALRFADGGADVAGHDIGAISQLEYLRQTRNREFAVLWLASGPRGGAPGESPIADEDRHYAALDIPSLEMSLPEYAALNGTDGGFVPAAELADAVTRYRLGRDVRLLRGVVAGAAPSRLLRAVDPLTGRAYLLIVDPDSARLQAAAALAPTVVATIETIPPDDAAEMERALAAGSAWLVFGGR